MSPRSLHSHALHGALVCGVLVVAMGGGAVLASAATPSGDGQATRSAHAPAADPWAQEYTATEYAERIAALEGHASGVGVRLRIERDLLVIAGVDRGSPADRAGVQAGEQVLAVGGRPVQASDLADVVRDLRSGGTATTVSGPDGIREVALPVAMLPGRSVSVRRMASGASLVRVDAMVRDAAEGVDRLLTDDQNSPAAGVVLDLRGNGGGFVTEAVELAGVFIDGGPGVTYPRANGSMRSLDIPISGGDVTAPLVVLVDGATASSAEIVAGILQDRGRAVVIGATTFGKGTVQAPTLTDAGSVHERTLGQYVLPSGREIDHEGIAPDVVVDDQASDNELMRIAGSVLRGLAPTDQDRR
jgi:carboxyl-terminal processing protease